MAMTFRSLDEHDSLKAGLANVEASLDEQRQSLALMMNDLEKIQQSLLDRQDAVLRTLEEENGHLRSPASGTWRSSS